MIDEFEAEFSCIIEECAGSRIALLGIGNELKGDDAVGLAIIDRLNALIDNPLILTLNCQNAPENFTGSVKRLKPSCVVLIDAADFDAMPGEVRIFRLDDLKNAATTTHKAPFNVLGMYLHSETGANVFVIGIQPEDCRLGLGLSPSVQSASVAVADVISTVLNRFRTKEG
jgi:hydrogenase 3 maturation protease